MTRTPEEIHTDVFRAYFDARRHKRGTPSQISFEMDLERNLSSLCDEICSRTYHPSAGMCFITRRPVQREIFASPFRDRVVHHLLYNYINPVFDRLMIHDCYSCRSGKGTLEGVRRIEHHIRSCSDNFTRDAYVLKLDLRGYFMSIDKSILYDIISRGLRRHPDGLDQGLCDYLVRSLLFRDPSLNVKVLGSGGDWEGLPPSKSLLKSAPGVGLPIGDLTSQLFSNIYLNELDQWVKRSLHCRHYGRYVDDFFIIDESREHLLSLVPKIRSFLKDELRATLHPDKVYIQHVSKGVQFLGARSLPHRRLPSGRTVSSFLARVREYESELRFWVPPERVRRMSRTLNSYLGCFQHYDMHGMLESVLGASPLRRVLRFSPGYSKTAVRAGTGSAGLDRFQGCLWPGGCQTPPSLPPAVEKNDVYNNDIARLGFQAGANG